MDQVRKPLKSSMRECYFRLRSCEWGLREIEGYLENRKKAFVIIWVKGVVENEESSMMPKFLN